MKEDLIHGKDDISAQEEAARQGSRIQVQNEHSRRKKGSCSQKSQGQKETDSLTVDGGSRSNVAFFFMCAEMTERKNSFEKEKHLRKRQDFNNCYRTGKSWANRLLVLYVCGNGMDRNRLGISVSKKVGNSVVRHRVMRLVRESYRLHQQMFNSGLDMAVVARSAAGEADYQEIRSAFLHLARKAGVLRKGDAVL